MWKNPFIPACKKIIKISNFFPKKICGFYFLLGQFKGFILNIGVDWKIETHIEISSIFQTELKIWKGIFLPTKKNPSL